MKKSKYTEMEFPQPDGHRSAAFRGLFKRLWADVAEMAMTTTSIVEHFYVVEDVGAGLIASPIYLFLDAFLFQAAEERFSYCIIPTVTSSTHAGFEVMRDTESIPGIATVLSALIGMNDNGFRWATTPY